MTLFLGPWVIQQMCSEVTKERGRIRLLAWTLKPSAGVGSPKWGSRVGLPLKAVERRWVRGTTWYHRWANANQMPLPQKLATLPRGVSPAVLGGGWAGGATEALLGPGESSGRGQVTASAQGKACGKAQQGDGAQWRVWSRGPG